MADFNFMLRIYWEDTDAGGIVFYANYLKFFERARTEWLRTLGINQLALREQKNIQLVVTHTQTNYRLPARLDDLLRITACIKQTTRASVLFEQQAFRQSAQHEELLCEGVVKVACVNASTMKPERFPPQLLSALTCI